MRRPTEMAGQPLERLAQSCARGIVAANREAIERGMQPLGHDRLQQVVDGVHLEGRDGMVLVRGREDDQGVRRQPFSDLEPAQPRHVDVEEDDVDRVGGELRESLRRVRSATDDCDAAARLQQASETLERERLVVDEERTQKRGHAPGLVRGSETVTSVPPSRRPTLSMAAPPKRPLNRD